MAGELIGGAVLGDIFSRLSGAILPMIQKNLYFEPELNKMLDLITSTKPIFNDMEKKNEELGQRTEETNNFINLLKSAEDLVRDCEDIEDNFETRRHYGTRLDDVNKSLREFVKFHLQLQMARDSKETLLRVKNLGKKGAWSSGVPLPKHGVIGFEDQVRALKAMVLKDPIDDECSVVVVSGVGGCGKTTLVTTLCGDRQIQGKFGENIYFVTVSRTPDLKVVVKNLLQRNLSGQLLDFASNEAAIQQWGSFLGENDSEVLLVLDDVWSDTIVQDFIFKSPKYKILVTSRITFSQFNTYKLQVLKHQDATKLFRHSAFSDQGNEHSDIPDHLIDKVVKHCENHPLALRVIGSSLKRKRVEKWERMSNKLSKKDQSIWGMHDSLVICLEKSLDLFKEEHELKDCYMDLGLFPEDQKISATMLMDMWVHLYNHDEDGLDTINILIDLSSKNLATLLETRKHLPVIANHCEEESVMQHDMMRTLAIRLSRQEPVEHRERLILYPYGQGLCQLPETLNARILSITTDEIFFLTWNDIEVPKVEVFVLNFMSKMHPLPRFMQKMGNLKFLSITSYGYYFSKLENFPAPQLLSNLTTIRLDHVSISSVIPTILELKNLQKLSMIMCKIGKSFNEYILKIPNKLPTIVELDIDSCDDLVTFPAVLCNLVSLRKLSITNCHELTSLSEEFGNLENLEVLRLASCSNLTTLPESMRNLKKLRIIDLSYCLSLNKLPVHIGELGSLETIDVSGCTGLHELPESVSDLCKLKVVCDEEISRLWSDFMNVEIQVVTDDALATLLRIIPRGY